MGRKPLGLTGKTLDKAIAARQSGNLPVAESLFEAVLRSKPECVDALYLLGTLRAEAGQLDSAEALLMRAARLHPGSAFIHNNLGNVHLLQGKLEAAAAAFERALAQQADLIEAEVNLGLLLLRLGNAGAAEARLRSALGRRPAWPQIRVGIARALVDQERTAEAIAELEEALRQAPDYAPAHEMLGLQLERLGRREEAIRHLQRYIELARPGKHESEAHLLLARLGLSERPSRYPVRPMLRDYERKASHWDANVARVGMEFLGPKHVHDFVGTTCAGLRKLAVADLGCGTGLCGPSLRPIADRLVGVDLSQPMLDQAAAKGCYDQLACSDLLDFLAQRQAQFDLMVASGVFILFGDLRPVLEGVRGGLRPGGQAMFTAYRCDDGDIGVRGNLHFSHSPEYLRRVSAEAGLTLTQLDEVVHEYDYGVAQPGLVVVLQLP